MCRLFLSADLPHALDQCKSCAVEINRPTLELTPPPPLPSPHSVCKMYVFNQIFPKPIRLSMAILELQSLNFIMHIFATVDYQIEFNQVGLHELNRIFFLTI